GHRVEEQIEPFSLAADLLEKRADLSVARHIAGEERSLLTKLADQFLDVFFQALALIIENQSCARGRPRLRDRPSDASFICDPKDDPSFACENLFSHNAQSLGVGGTRRNFLPVMMSEAKHLSLFSAGTP